MRTKSIDYWINQLGKDKPISEPKDENENSYMQLAEYLLFREKEKTAA